MIRHRIDQELEAHRRALGACDLCHHRGEVPAGAVPRDYESTRVTTNLVGMVMRPDQGCIGINHRGRERMFRRQAIVDRDEDRVDLLREHSCRVVVGLERAEHPPAAVEEHDDRLRSIPGRAVDANRDVAIRSRDHPILHRGELDEARDDGAVHQGTHVVRARLRCHRPEPQGIEEFDHGLRLRVERHGRAPYDSVGAASRNRTASARNARPRCDSCCFSLSSISAKVRPPPPAGTKTGS